jgi:5-carboxymethyl-2-hydroxymuconate isomerase
MPHLHLSTSSNLVENVDLPDILRALADELSAHESIESASVKAYHSLHHTWAMGEGAPGGFAHLSVRLLSGRPEALRQQIADALLIRMSMLFRASLETGEAGLTVEVVEMDRATYRKASH